MTATLPVDLRERRTRRNADDRVDTTPSSTHPVRRGLGVLGAMAIAVVLLSLFGVAVFQARITEQGYELEQIRDTIGVRQERSRDLKIEVASLESPTRMKDRASELGLGRSDSIRFLDPSSAVVDSVLGTGRTSTGIDSVLAARRLATGSADGGGDR